MGLPYRPTPGEILICAFDDVAYGAEMVKRRPVVVVSCFESHSRSLCSVVPLSTTEPPVTKPWHHVLHNCGIVGWPHAPVTWVKCDMVCTVSFTRLNQPYRHTRQSGRVYQPHHLATADLAAVRDGLRAYLKL